MINIVYGGVLIGFVIGCIVSSLLFVSGIKKAGSFDIDTSNPNKDRYCMNFSISPSVIPKYKWLIFEVRNGINLPKEKNDE